MHSTIMESHICLTQELPQRRANYRQVGGENDDIYTVRLEKTCQFHRKDSCILLDIIVDELMWDILFVDTRCFIDI